MRLLCVAPPHGVTLLQPNLQRHSRRRQFHCGIDHFSAIHFEAGRHCSATQAAHTQPRQKIHAILTPLRHDVAGLLTILWQNRSAFRTWRMTTHHDVLSSSAFGPRQVHFLRVESSPGLPPTRPHRPWRRFTSFHLYRKGRRFDLQTLQARTVSLSLTAPLGFRAEWIGHASVANLERRRRHRKSFRVRRHADRIATDSIPSWPGLCHIEVGEGIRRERPPELCKSIPAQTAAIFIP